MLAFMLLSSYTFAQSEKTYFKYWVSLVDKKGTPFSIDKPEEFLTTKAIERRKKFNINLTEDDLPVSPIYIEKVGKQSNITVLYSSKWLNAVVVRTENEYDIDAVEDLEFVTEVKLLGKWKIKKDEDKKEDKKKKDDFKGYEGDDDIENVRPYLGDIMTRGYGSAYYQTRMLNLIKMHDLGYKGYGLTIAVVDAGFKNYYRHRALDSMRANGQFIDYYNIPYGDKKDNDNGKHGLQVLSCMAANIPNTMVGTAPGANYLLISSEDEKSEFPIEEANWVRAAEYADSMGADLITSSLGYKSFDLDELSHEYKDINGKISYASQAATRAVEKGIMVLAAAGNDGDNKKSNYVASPGDADKIITVGGVDYDREHTSFSSYGPTFDKRIKPDLCAKASYVYVANSNNKFARSNGTSFATPIMAGAVACLMQANPEKSVAEVMDALKKSADHSFNPNSTYGWGIPDIFVANSFLNESAYFDYNTEKLINPGINEFNTRIYYRFYSPTSQQVNITVTKINIGKKKKTKEVFNSDFQVSAKDFLQGEIPKVEKFKSGEYIFKLTSASGKVYERTIEK